MSRLALVFTSCIILISSSLAGAERVAPRRAEIETVRTPQPLLSIAAWDEIPAAVELAPATTATPERVQALREWNRRGGKPSRNGFVRSLPTPILFTASPSVASNSTEEVVQAQTKRSAEFLSQAARVTVEQGYGIRLGLKVSNSDKMLKLWVKSGAGDLRFFDLSLMDAERRLWTPSVEGPDVTLIVEAPIGVDFSLLVADVVEIIEPNAEEYCLRDVMCQTRANIEDYRTSVTRYQGVDGANSFVCTGGLINDRESSFTPYVLTAHHCVSSPSAALSVEAFWDYRSEECGGSPPSLWSVPRTNGASLTTTWAKTDVSLLRLNSTPPGERWFMGWWPRNLNQGERLNRISHPVGRHQAFSTSEADNFTGTCEGWGRPAHHYSRASYGNTAPGSSGAPMWDDEGYILGQLVGHCGPDPSANCDLRNYQTDGSLRESWAVLKPILDPEPVSCSACSEDKDTACLLGGRFKVEVRWRNKFQNPTTSGDGSVVSYAENDPEMNPTWGPISEMAYFSFFSHAPERVELVVKMVNGVTINDRFWVILGGMVDNEYWVTITDTETCQVWERYNSHGQFSTIKDQNAFCCSR